MTKINLVTFVFLVITLLSSCKLLFKSEKNNESVENKLVVENYNNILISKGYKVEDIEKLFETYQNDNKYISKYKNYELKEDTLILNINKIHKKKKGYTQVILEKVYTENDTLICRAQKWNALGRVSPNTMQIITITVNKYDKRMRKISKIIKEYHLLMFNSSLTTTKILYDEFGKEKKKSNNRVYKLLEEGMPKLMK